ncbi:MAG: glucuronate isomerase [Verrucomicrobia bacterium]|nr:glucuronate isomerase [Verrucomicrobiota bacterium]
MKSLSADENFLLRSPLARRLYHEHAAALPIIDYHSHLDAGDLAADRTYRDLTQLWLEPDQYKHRAMRLLGVPEQAITGDASPREKFDHWAATLPQTLGNPLYHWSALELRRYFGVTEPLNPASADRIWAQCNEQLAGPSHRARGLLAAANVELVGTSDRWLDPLDAHRQLGADGFIPRVLPSLRADDALAIDEPGFRDWLGRLAAATGTRVSDLDSYRAALNQRLDVFAAHGCTIADHGLDVFAFEAVSDTEANATLSRVLTGGRPDAAQTRAFRSSLLAWLGESYGRRGWVMQLHLGAQRHTSSRLRRLAGAAGGFAMIGRATDIPALCRCLDHLEIRDALPKTILYPLNPADHAAFAVLTGSFTEDHVAGKIQFGPPWWFNDHDLGIRQHLDTLSRYGLLAPFIGMTTDSRSVLSLSRHEYFRRVLCDWFGAQVQAGIFPDDPDFLGNYVRRVAGANARAWLASPAALSLP